MSAATLFVRPRAGGAALLCALMLAACGGDDNGQTASPAPESSQAQASPTVLHWTLPEYAAPDDWAWNLPDYFPPPRVPADNPMRAEKVALGRWLFYDKRLSGNGTQACATCHEQSRAFSDGRARALGSTGVVHPRGAMALVNVAWNATYTWANSALPSLERQIPNPIFGTEPVELGVSEDAVAVVLERLRADSRYPAMFAAAFGTEQITWQRIMQAITSFERTLVSVHSRYDHYLQGKATLTESEQNGLRVFHEAQCDTCHGGPNFTDQFISADTREIRVRYHNVGLYNLDGQGAYPADSEGVFEITANLADIGAFRAPTLRNIEVSAPYMHDGSLATLEEVVDLFAEGGWHISEGALAGDGRASPLKSRLVRARALSAQDRADLVAFLKTLTDPAFLTDPSLSDPFQETAR